MRQTLLDARLRRAVRRSSRRSRSGRGSLGASSRRFRGRPHSQCEDGAQSISWAAWCSAPGWRCWKRRASDQRTGRIMKANLAEYLVPVNADIARGRRVLVPEDDPHVNEIGVKGIGEIGIVGAAAAIANAVYHATGKRVRDLPITPESCSPNARATKRPARLQHRAGFERKSPGGRAGCVRGRTRRAEARSTLLPG